MDDSAPSYDQKMASRRMVFSNDHRQLEEAKTARLGIDSDKRAQLLEDIATGVVDIGPKAAHKPLDPALRPNVKPQTNGHRVGWKPH
jgi:hypothetical protein